MARKLIIDSTTRIVRGMTTQASPPIAAHEILIDIPDDLEITLSPNMKLGVDEKTLTSATPEEIEAYLDIVNPRRVKMRTLERLVDAIEKDETSPLNIKNFVRRVLELI